MRTDAPLLETLHGKWAADRMVTARLIGRRRMLSGLGAALAVDSAVCAVPSRSDAPLDVLVIGAGLSGLNAALLVKAQGFKVAVLEGRRRVGGRVHSLRGVEGNPELGGDSILGGYGRMQDTARRLGIRLVDHAGHRDLSPDARVDPTSVELALGGEIISRAAWPNHPRNAMPDGAKDRFPGRAFFQAVIDRHNPLKSFEDWTDAASAQFDGTTDAFLKNLGWSDATIDLNYNINVQYGMSARDVSILMWFYTQAWFKLQSEMARVAYKAEGGNESIPEAMAAAVGDVHLGERVTGIQQTAGAVSVTCSSGRVMRAKRVICSMPLPAMAAVRFDPALPVAKLRALQSVPVMRITKVVLVPKKPFWKEDGLSPAMWTDCDVGEIRALREGSDPDRVNCLMAWGRGPLAEQLDTLGEAGAIARVVAEYERLRPAAKGQLIGVGYKSWQSDPFAGGDWVVWRPGQIHEYLLPLKEPSGRLHFCGEHTAIANRGMEGAMESGERAALEAMALL